MQRPRAGDLWVTLAEKPPKCVLLNTKCATIHTGNTVQTYMHSLEHTVLLEFWLTKFWLVSKKSS